MPNLYRVADRALNTLSDELKDERQRGKRSVAEVAELLRMNVELRRKLEIAEENAQLLGFRVSCLRAACISLDKRNDDLEAECNRLGKVALPRRKDVRRVWRQLWS